MIEASQLLIDGRYFVGLKARKEIHNSADEQFEIDRIDVKLSVMAAYYTALAAVEAEKLLRSNLETIEELLEETKALYENGFGEELDVDRLLLNKANLEAKIRNAEKYKVNAINSLKFRMGVDLSKEITLVQTLNFFVDGMQALELQFPDPMFRPEFRLLEITRQLREYDVSQKRAGYYPSLYAFAKGGTSAFRGGFDFFSDGDRWYPNGAAGITLNVPIFEGLKRNSIIQESKIMLEMSNNDIRQFQEFLEMEVNEKYTDYATAYDNFKNRKDNMGLAQKIFNKTSIMYKEGVGSSLDLATAESDLTTSQVDYINAILDLLVAKTLLDKSQGKL